MYFAFTFWFSLVYISNCTHFEYDKYETLHIQYTASWWCGPGSSVGIANGYRLDGSGSNPGGDEIFRTCPYGPGAHSASRPIGTGSFQGVNSGRSVTLTPHPLPVPWTRKSRAIPLLPLWAVRPVQSLNACTRVHFTLPCTSWWWIVSLFETCRGWLLK